MVLKTARFISLLLTALATGIVFSHVLKISNKAALPGSIYLSQSSEKVEGYPR